MHAQIVLKQFEKSPPIPHFGPMSFYQPEVFMVGRDIIFSHSLKQELL